MKTFRELEVWQVSMDLSKAVYMLTGQFPREERYGLSDQIRRAAVSIPSNIAEGFGRETTRDFVHFLAMARGSLFELDTQLELADSVGYFEYTAVLRDSIGRVGMMLNALSGSLKKKMSDRTTNHEPRTTNHEP